MSTNLALLKQVRSPERIRTPQIVHRIVEDFEPLSTPDPALLAGYGRIAGTEVLALGQIKASGRDPRSGRAVNYGMMKAAGYWFVCRQLEIAARRGVALVTLVDTPGADPSGESVEQLLAWAVSASISRLLAFAGPSVSVLVGEGGSGGALALQVADRRLMVSDAMYYVIAPESCSVILHRDRHHIDEAVDLLRPKADQVVGTGIIDEVVDWPDAVALTDHDKAAAILKDRVAASLDFAASIDRHDRLSRRSGLYFACGRTRNGAGLGSLAHDGTPATAPGRGRPSRVVPRKLVRVTSGDDVTAALQNAYYGCDMSRTLLCPPGNGGCGTVFPEQELEAHGWACPHCGLGERLGAYSWIDVLCGNDFEELCTNLELGDLHDAGYENEAYRGHRQAACRKLGVGESLVAGIGRIQGVEVAVAISDFRFMGGTLGAVAGEKLRILSEVARADRLPMVTLTCSGGVRMQEGTLGLAQMAKANAAIFQLTEAGLPHISILADPCTGGALGSYATYATAVVAEPHALVAFAGPRVMDEAGLHLPREKLDADYLTQFGGIDEIVARDRLAGRLGRYLRVARESMPSPTVSVVPELGTEPTEPRTPRSVLSELCSELQSAVHRASGSDDVGAGDALARFVVELADLALIDVPGVLSQLLEHPDSRVRANAVAALGRFSDARTDAARLLDALTDNSSRVRANAVVSLLSRNPDNDDALRCVQDLLQAADSRTTRSGLFVATRLPLPGALQTVVSLYRHEDPLVRVTAAVAGFSQADAERAGRVLEELATSLGGAYVCRVARRMLPFMPKGPAHQLEAWLQSRAPQPQGASSGASASA